MDFCRGIGQTKVVLFEYGNKILHLCSILFTIRVEWRPSLLCHRVWVLDLRGKWVVDAIKGVGLSDWWIVVDLRLRCAFTIENLYSPSWRCP